MNMLNAAYVGTEASEPLVDMLISAVDLFDIVYTACAVSAEGAPHNG